MGTKAGLLGAYGDRSSMTCGGLNGINVYVCIDHETTWESQIIE